jgi:HEAT repeat protein
MDAFEPPEASVTFVPNRDSSSSQIVYLAHKGELASAIDRYKAYAQERGHDYGLVRSLASSILQTAMRSGDAQMETVALFGAAYSGDRSLLGLIGQAVDSRAPERAMQAVSLLADLDEDAAGQHLRRALGSPFLPIRLEACYGLVRRGEEASGYLASLVELGEPVQLAACELLSAQDTAGSTAMLRRLMARGTPRVRAAAIWSCGARRRDDFLPVIRQTLTHIDPVEQEACCNALGRLGDTTAIPDLRRIAESRADTPVRLAALGALYQLGDRTARFAVEEEARNGNRHAISLLGDMEGSEPVLIAISRCDDLTLRTVACISLLKRRHPGSWPGLAEVLIRDPRDLIWLEDRTPGFSLVSWKRVASATQQCANQPHLLHYADRWRHELLVETSNLPGSTFTQIAQIILETNQNDLVMITTRILEHLGTPEALALLHRMSEQAGAPFVRTACHLALMRIHEEGPHEERLLQWMTQNSNAALKVRETARPDPAETYRITLTPDERAQLMLDITSALAAHPTANSIDTLLTLMATAHPTVRVAMAACLLQSLT